MSRLGGGEESYGRRLRVVRALPSMLKPKPVHECGDAPHQKVGWFRARNGVFSLGRQALLSAVSEDHVAVSASSQS